MRLLFAFPGILLAISVVAVLGSGMANVILAVAIFSIPAFARLVRGNTLALTFTTEVEDNRLARSVVRRLAKAGVPVTLETGGDTDETLQGV